MAEDAKNQRYEAFLSFMAHNYVQCSEHLDHAQPLDEPKDSKPEIEEQRRLCAEALAQPRDH